MENYIHLDEFHYRISAGPAGNGSASTCYTSLPCRQPAELLPSDQLVSQLACALLHLVMRSSDTAGNKQQ